MAANVRRAGQPVQTPQAIHDGHVLLLWIIPQRDKFPRLRRYTLGERIETPLLQVLERLLDAAYSPIGNLTSQIFANLYLNDIDHWLSGEPACGAYLRYVDDPLSNLDEAEF